MSKKRVQGFIDAPLDEAAINTQLSGITTKLKTVKRIPEDENDVPVVVRKEHTFVDVWFSVDSEAVTFNTWLKDTHTTDGYGYIYVCGHDDSPRTASTIQESDKWTVSPP